MRKPEYALLHNLPRKVASHMQTWSLIPQEASHQHMRKLRRPGTAWLLCDDISYNKNHRLGSLIGTMPILIDGHNLIGHLPTISLADEDDEAQLVLLLRKYAAQKRGRRVVVIFDRGNYGHPLQLNGYGVECHFTYSPQDADRELIRRIRAIKRAGSWQVVTSDRAVAGEARANNIVVIPSHQFADRLLARPQSQSYGNSSEPIESHKEHILTPQEIEEWLRIFGATDEIGKPDERRSKAPPPPPHRRRKQNKKT